MHASDYEDEEELVQWGVTPLMHYDPLGRLTQTLLPNGTLARVAIDPWRQVSWDPNDTLLESRWYQERMALAGLIDPQDQSEQQAEYRAEHRAALITSGQVDPKDSLKDPRSRPRVMLKRRGNPDRYRRDRLRDRGPRRSRVPARLA